MHRIYTVYVLTLDALANLHGACEVSELTVNNVYLISSDCQFSKVMWLEACDLVVSKLQNRYCTGYRKYRPANITMQFAVSNADGLVSNFVIKVLETGDNGSTGVPGVSQVRGDLKLLPSCPRRCVGLTRLEQVAFSDVLQVDATSDRFYAGKGARERGGTGGF